MLSKTNSVSSASPVSSHPIPESFILSKYCNKPGKVRISEEVPKVDMGHMTFATSAIRVQLGQALAANIGVSESRAMRYASQIRDPTKPTI